MKLTDPHYLGLLRRRAMNRAVAQKLREDSSLTSIAKENLTRWMSQQQSRRGFVSASYLEWDKILKMETLETILSILEEESEEADRLQHCSPFAGVLTEDEVIAFSSHGAYAA